MSDSIDYSAYMRRSLQSMIGDILGDIAEDGLPGDNHFFMKFKTNYPGVDVPDHLAEDYPDEMTIILQEWFDDLGVMDDRFAVTLSFNGVAEMLVVPFAAITEFADPSVQFQLRFDVPKVNEMAEDGIEPIVKGFEPKDKKYIDDDATGEEAKVISLDDFRKRKD